MGNDQNNINPGVPSEPVQTPAPVPDVAPASEPASNVGTQMDSLLNNTATNTAIAKDEIKPKKGLKLSLLIIILVVVAALAGGGVFAAFWLTNHTKPENVVLNSITKAMGRKAVRLNGSLNFSGEAAEDAGIKKVTMVSKGESSILPSSSETTISIVTVDDDVFEIKTSEIVLENGVFYLKVDGLMETVEKVIPEELSPYVEYFGEILEEIEGVWWKFDISDFGMPEEVTDAYDCSIKMMNSLDTSDTRNEFIGLYKEWPLLDVSETDKKDGDYKGYGVSLNNSNAAGFINNVRGTNFYKDFAKCAKSIDENFEDYDDIKADDIKIPEDFPTFVVFANPWSHELRSIKWTYAGEGMDISGELELEFIDSVNISAPKDAKSILDLVENVMLKMCSMMGVEEEDCSFDLSDLLGSQMDYDDEYYFYDDDDFFGDM